MKTLTLGALRRHSGLARATLLHYEALGLLLPAARSAAGYRLYGEEALARLDAIRAYREAGLSLQAITALLAGEGGGNPARLLRERLMALSREIEVLRGQQQTLARLLADPALRAQERAMDKAGWVAMLRAAGLDEADMLAWHAAFEAADPAGHTAFLRSLGLAEAEVAEIRRRDATQSPR